MFLLWDLILVIICISLIIRDVELEGQGLATVGQGGAATVVTCL